MESPHHKFALYGGTNECFRTDTHLLPLSEVSTRAVLLIYKLKIQVFFSFKKKIQKNSHYILLLKSREQPKVKKEIKKII